MSIITESTDRTWLGYSPVDTVGETAVAARPLTGVGRPPISSIGYWGNGAVTAREAQTTLVRELAERVPELSGRHVLDVDCGLGGPAGLIAAEYGAEVDAISPSAEQVEAARAFAAAQDLDEGRLRFHVGSATAPPFADGSFDVVFSFEMAHRLGDKPRFVREAYRVLRPGGRIVLSDITASIDLPVARRLPGVEPDLVTPRRWRMMFEDVGFEVLEHRLLGSAIYAGYRRWLMLTAGERRRAIFVQLSTDGAARRPLPVRQAQAWLLEFAANRSVPGLTSAMHLHDYVLVVARRPAG